MSLKVIPTNIGGFNLSGAQLQGPLSSLFQNQNPQNLVYPSDLGSNPAMGHAVMFEIFDYKSGFEDAAKNAIESLKKINDVSFGNQNGDGTFSNLIEGTSKITNIIKDATFNLGLKAIQAGSYQRQTKNKLANISLYMPDTLNVTYNSNYTDVSLTESLGLKGFIGNAYSDLKNPALTKEFLQTVLQSDYGKAAAAKAAGNLLGPNLSEFIQQSAGIYINPQIQLLYKGVGLRTFQLEFIFTPKTSQEAQVSKDICDSFAFYSLPSFGSNSNGESGQFLKPPQLFRIKFKFLGKNDVLGSVSNVFSSALSNAGLGFLNSTNPTNTIMNGNEAKVMTINDCVLQNVQVDYAPNGWAAYNDGYPIQTRLTLQFMEMQMPTKDTIKNSRVTANYNNQAEDVVSEKMRLERVYATRDSAYNDAGY